MRRRRWFIFSFSLSLPLFLSLSLSLSLSLFLSLPLPLSFSKEPIWSEGCRSDRLRGFLPLALNRRKLDDPVFFSHHNSGGKNPERDRRTFPGSVTTSRRPHWRRTFNDLSHFEQRCSFSFTVIRCYWVHSVCVRALVDFFFYSVSTMYVV